MVVTIPKKCVVCNKKYEVQVDAEKYNLWIGGELIQNVWPEFSVVQREQLISGVCSDECWKKLWAD